MSNLKYIPTKKLKEILSNPYGCTDIGSDYEENLDEIREIIWSREDKAAQDAFDQYESESLEEAA